MLATTVASKERPRPGAFARVMRACLKWLGSSIALLALAYPLLLVAAVLLLRFVGETHWLTALALYLPRIGFGLPLPFLVAGLCFTRRFRLLWTQAVALVLVLFPLMGLVVPNPWPVRSGSPGLRVMSFNVNSGYSGYEKIAAAIVERSPDVFVAQESVPWGGLEELLLKHYPHADTAGQFVLASRFPITGITEPGRVPHGGRERSPRFLRFVVETPKGPVAIYDMHPISSRGTLGLWRFRDTLHRLRTGALFSESASDEVLGYAELRMLQVRKAATMARSEGKPVIMAGDFNLPGLSPVLHDELAEFRDGFSAAGSGFGYTFPERYPFLRLDRVLATREFEFTGFEVGCKAGLSDHFCVVADLVWAK